MEEFLKKELGVKSLNRTGIISSGCISEGEAYVTDSGYIFVKRSKRPQARSMFESEYASLSALHKTNTIRVPKPIKVISGAEEHFIAIEYINMTILNNRVAKLGEKLADLHLYNETVAKKGASELPYTDKFGFDIPTACGSIIHDNTWSDDWPIFYARTRLDFQVKMLQENKGDREVGELWSQLQLIIPKFFDGAIIKPCLIHGDLWSGNASETKDEPVIYDPGCLYADYEFELAMTNMFGGFSKYFYRSYYTKIPKRKGYETREKLYKLFHYLNHWNHFGISYRSPSISIMKGLLKTKFPLK